MINMHIYLHEKYRSPFLYDVFLFSKVGVLAIDFNGFFALAYSSHLLWPWPLGRTWYHHTSLSSAPLSQGLTILPDIFLKKGILESTLPCIFYCPPAWSSPQVFNSRLGMRLCEGRLDKKLFSCRNFGISKLFQTQKSFWDRFKANSFWRNSSDSYGEVFKSDGNFLFCFWWKIWSDTWLVKKVSDLIWGFQRTSVQNIHFICMNNDLVCMRKHCLPIQIACLWSERAWLGT